MTCVIGLCGKKQSGKNTFAKIAEEYKGLKVQQLALADALKDFCADYMGIAPKLCRGSDKDKNTIVGSWGEYFSSNLQTQFKKEWDSPLSVREILQVVGTEIFRGNFTDDFWMKIVLKKIENYKQYGGYDFIFITDVRFPNEVKTLKIHGAKIVRLYRNTGCTDTIPHASELAMDTIDAKLFDYIVPAEKNITPETLRPVVQEILLKEIRR